MDLSASRRNLWRVVTAHALSVWLACLGCVDFLAIVVAQEAGTISAEHLEFFERDVRPLLIKRCSECHGGTKADGGLSLASADGWRRGGDNGPAIVPGQPDESLLIKAINYRSLEMPPAERGPLPAEEIAILTKWVAVGAPDPRDGTEVLGGMTREEAQDWWAFQPLPELSQADFFADVRHIDQLIQAEVDRQGLTVAPFADPRTLFRRLSYGLTGLPPTATEVESFIADKAPDAWTRTIDRLLAMPQYGEHWGRHWLDVVRYADTAGENTDRPLPHAWRYRNWVIESFQNDLAFDQFVREQLAGDLLTEHSQGKGRADGIVATGYLAIARRFGHDIDKDMFLTYEDVIDNVGKNFLGLTIGCARCHDHKYDPISAEDYYAMYGIFESTKFSFPGCEPKGQPRDLVPILTSAEIDALMKPWNDKVALLAAAKERLDAETRSLSQSIEGLWTSSKKVLAKVAIEEGSSSAFEQKVVVRRGEVLLLSVFPNDNYGADSTLVNWTIQEASGEQRTWDVAEVVPNLLQGNPQSGKDGAVWSFLEVTNGPKFLTDRRDLIAGRTELKSWSLGSEPSVFVNTAHEHVSVWTSLPPHSFFVHPGDRRPVGVAWTSPVDGEVVLKCQVSDAHPAGGLDGVSCELAHFVAPDLGAALLALGNVNSVLPDPGPAPTIPVAYAVVDQVVKNARVHVRGDPEQLGSEVPRRWLTVFGGLAVPMDSGSGRRELSEWVSRHPLAARVMVNRVWEWHFGRGLVRSSNDFGSRGDRPTHPELLDFLAARFVQSGYSVKSLHRLLLHTEAYRRASQTSAAADPDNRWLSHFSRRRLTAEELRDSLLKVSGRLDSTSAEGHPFPAEASWSFSQHVPFNAVYETNRRSVYLMVQRQRRHPFLALFDGADPNASTPTRQTTIVPTQALYFINDAFFHDQATALAERVVELPNEEDRFREVMPTLFQRAPTESETRRFHNFMTTYPADLSEKWAAQIRVLLASNEFLFVD